MEEKKIPLRLRRKYMRGFDSIRDVTHIFRLKINRTLYKGIDWDELKSLTWNQWRKRYLNVLMDGDIKKIEHGDEWKCEPQYLYLEVDTTADFELIEKIFNHFIEMNKNDFSLADVISFINQNPYLKDLNKNVHRRWKKLRNE